MWSFYVKLVCLVLLGSEKGMSWKVKNWDFRFICDSFVGFKIDEIFLTGEIGGRPVMGFLLITAPQNLQKLKSFKQ